MTRKRDVLDTAETHRGPPATAEQQNPDCWACALAQASLVARAIALVVVVLAAYAIAGAILLVTGWSISASPVIEVHSRYDAAVLTAITGVVAVLDWLALRSELREVEHGV